MKKRIVISESERQKILSQHKSVIKNESELKKQSLSEREMSKLINNVLLNEGLSVKNNNRVVLTEDNWCDGNICNTGLYGNGNCSYFGNGVGNCVFSDGSVCGWDTGANGPQWTSGPCHSGAATQGGATPSKLPKPTTTTPTAPTGKPKPISTSTTTTSTKQMKEDLDEIIYEIEMDVEEIDETIYEIELDEVESWPKLKWPKKKTGCCRDNYPCHTPYYMCVNCECVKAIHV
jgi:hypothetical protein